MADVSLQRTAKTARKDRRRPFAERQSRQSGRQPGNFPLYRCFFAQIGAKSATVGGGGYDEVQSGHRLHSGRGASLFRLAGREAAAGGTDAGSRRAPEKYPQGNGPGNDAEGLAAGDPQGFRAAAANVFREHAGRKRQKEIAVTNGLRTARLLLREWRDEDGAAFAELSADPAVMRYLVPFADRAAMDA